MKNKKTIELLALADSLGFKSLHQLSVFILHYENQGRSMADITGLEISSAAYKRHYGAVRKLMNGSRDRGYDGLRLLYNGGQLEGMRPNEIAIYITKKGYEWADILGISK